MIYPTERVKTWGKPPHDKYPFPEMEDSDDAVERIVERDRLIYRDAFWEYIEDYSDEEYCNSF